MAVFCGVLFRGGAAYSIGGRSKYPSGSPAYLGPACLAVGASFETFRNELRVFYPLNFAPTAIVN
jgi:hypothetical protein